MSGNASNFEFLQQHWSFLLDDAQRVEINALRDPRTAAFYARRTLERALIWLYENDSALKVPYKKNLAAMLHEPTFKGNIKSGLFTELSYIHRLGNLAVHADQAISSQEGMKVCVALHVFTGWLARVYTRGGAAPTQFSISLLPRAEPLQSASTSVVELQAIREQLQEKDAAEKRAREQQQQTEAELAELKAQLEQLQAIKQENLPKIPATDYSEAQTRDEFIDVMLREAGWNPKGKNVEEYEVQGMPSDSGIGYVDYVLWGDDGLPLAVVEAKKTKVDAKVGKHQAELYADCLEQKFSQRPVIFYTNGYNTWLWDDTVYPPREVQGFYTRDQLQWLINRRSSQQALTSLQAKSNIAGRYYQMEAAARVMETFDTQRKRKSLIVMATGTGKTRLSVSIVEMLTRANWSRRTLFLADRKALVRQAKRAYKSLLPNYSVKSLVEPDKDDVSVENARIVFSTYPSILNIIDGTKKDQLDTFSVGHFDLIIIDEAHRSVYQKYGAIFDYFDSLLIGLTATPRDELDRDTYKLFELSKGQPTYAYELSQAVADEFLVPPKAISVPVKFQREGIKYSDLSAEEQDEYELQESFYEEESGELKEEISAGALNKWLFNQNTIDKVLMHLMENGLKIEGGDKLGKTIVFAKSSKHADEIVKSFDKNYPAYKGKFCQKIDFSVKYPQSLIDKFSIKNKYPQIAVSVDMLDTGIDVPEVLNLVFFKLVRSKTKFWQMVGRGTRLCEHLFAPNEHKREFMIFDYCQNLEYFDTNPQGYDSAVQPSLKHRIFNLRLQLAYALQEAKPDDKALVSFGEQLKDQLHTLVQGFNIDNFIVRKQRAIVEEFAQREQWQQLTEKDLVKLGDKLAGLPSIDNDHETARRFDSLILNLQTALLANTNRQAFYQKAIREIAINLEDKKAIPLVAAEMELILALQTDEWWRDVTLPMLETVRFRLRNLIQFVDNKTQAEEVYTDFEDTLIKEDAAEYNLIKTDASLQDYRVRVEKIIREHKDHITIRRLKNNETVTQADIHALEDILFSDDVGVSRDDYENIYGEKPIGLLVRSITGLDRRAAKEAFAKFLDKAPLHPNQIAFLNEVVEYLVKNGVVEPKELFDSPFTHYHDMGVSGVMGDKLAKKVIELVETINSNAGVQKNT